MTKISIVQLDGSSDCTFTWNENRFFPCYRLGSSNKSTTFQNYQFESRSAIVNLVDSNLTFFRVYFLCLLFSLMWGMIIEFVQLARHLRVLHLFDPLSSVIFVICCICCIPVALRVISTLPIIGTVLETLFMDKDISLCTVGLPSDIPDPIFGSWIWFRDRGSGSINSWTTFPDPQFWTQILDRKVGSEMSDGAVPSSHHSGFL